MRTSDMTKTENGPIKPEGAEAKTRTFSDFLVDKFDTTVQIPDFDARETQNIIYTKVLLEPLSTKYNLNKDELSKVQLKIINRKTDEQEEIALSDPLLQEVNDALTKEYGKEVSRRLVITYIEQEQI